MTKAKITSVETIDAKAQLEKELDFSKQAQHYFEQAIKWSQATVKMYETHLEEAKLAADAIQEKLSRFGESTD